MTFIFIFVRLLGSMNHFRVQNQIKILLFNPPGKILIRGEGRSDSETDPETSMAAAKWIYPPMNLAYGAAYLRQNGFNPLIRDYPAEHTTRESFLTEISAIKPDMVIANMNPSSEADDLWTMRQIHALFPACKIIVFAPYLSLRNTDKINPLWFTTLDVLLFAEQMELICPITKALLAQDQAALTDIPGIIFKPNGKPPQKTRKPPPADFSKTPLPARDLLNNNLYVRPDNGRPQALIQVGRGCPFKCQFCLTPKMTGASYSLRTVASVLTEIQDCIDNYKITQFFFRADTFTINKEWSRRFAQAIIDNKLNISWCANSRSNCFDEELAKLFKRSGCWLLAFGFESGSPETLNKSGKGTTVEQNELARKICRENGILVHGQYIIGFPWEGKEHLQQTFNHIKKIQCDFIDVQILVPYVGTDIYDEIKAKHPELLSAEIGSKITGGVNGTANGLTKEGLFQYQKRMLMANYLSPGAIMRNVARIRSMAELRNYSRYGWRFITGMLSR